MPNEKPTPDEEMSKLQRELDALKARKRSGEVSEAHKTVFDEAFGHRELYYVQASDRMFEHRRVWDTNPWASYTCSAFVNENPMLSSRGGVPAFMSWLRQRGAYHQKGTYSFKPQDASVLNCMRTDHWLKPMEGELHEMYDVLMLALGGGKQEGKDHIEQLIACKYRNPGNFLLPCVNWYDQGGVGKNLFVDGVLGGIFGTNQVSSVGLEHILGHFNSEIVGKTIILINEAANKKVDMEKMKNLVGQPTVKVNEKFVPVAQVDNTPLYFIATNDPMSIPLEGKNSDRRWSIIHLLESIESFVARHLNCGEAQAKELWITKFADELKEPDNLRVWLNHILKKWAHVGTPEPLHGEDYKMAIAIRQEINPVHAALHLLAQMETWTTLSDLYMHVTGEEKLIRDFRYQRFAAELNGAINKKKLPLKFERERAHLARYTFKRATAIVIRHIDYKGALTKDHFQM